MDGEDVGHVLAHWDAALRGFSFDDLVNDAIGPRHDLRAIALMCAASLGHGGNSASETTRYLITTRTHPSCISFHTATVRVVIDSVELEAAIAAVYAAQLPIPAWWPAEARAAFIEEYASEAAGTVLSEMDAVVDRMGDWAARSQVSGADKTTVIASAQQVLLDEACSEVQYDLTELIASRSAELMAEAVFDHGPPHAQHHVVWPVER